MPSQNYYRLLLVLTDTYYFVAKQKNYCFLLNRNFVISFSLGKNIKVQLKL